MTSLNLYWWKEEEAFFETSFLVVIPLVFSPFCCQYLLYLPRVFFCEFCSLFSHLYMFFFLTEWTLSISSWIIYFSQICPFFTFFTSAISFRVNFYQFFLSDKFVLFYLFASFLPGFLLKAFMSQTKDFCGHFKVLWDNHPSCANCFHCCSWPLSTWLKFEQRRSYKPGWKEEICTCRDVRGR